MKKVLLIALITIALVLSAACASPAPAPAPQQPAAPQPAAPAETPDEDEPEAPTVDFPTRAITIYNSSTAGSPADVMARELARSIEELRGVPVTVHNATGGGGGVMFGSVFGTPSDGYTWGSFTAAQIASLQAGLDEDFPVDTFQFVANIQTDVHTLAVAYDAPWQTLEELLDYMRGRATPMLWGGQGTGSGMHLNALQLARDADVEFNWIPFDGGAVTVTQLLGGHVAVGITTPTTVAPYVEAEMLRMLAITGPGRLSANPEVPTFAELGFGNVALTQYRGVFVQADVDMAIVAAISDLIREATLTESFVTYMNLVNMDDAFMPYTQFHPYVLADLHRVGEMVDGLMEE